MATNFPMRLTTLGTVMPGATVQAVLLIGHPMESGFRNLDSGQRVPKNVIESIVVRLDATTVLEARIGIGISANPYFAFAVPLTAQMPPGGWRLTVEWLDDKGQRGATERMLTA
jgi:sulfur-oxidizing protein SoxZ